MRALRTSLLASILAVALAPTSRADEPIPALEKAERLEAEGRSMIEHGHKAEGANAISKAWRIRAEVWGSEQKMAGGDSRPELAALKERIAATKAASNEAEKAGHALKEAGKVEDAQAKMEESGRLWREAEAMQRKLERAVAETREQGGDGREAKIRELKTQAARAREEAEGAANEAVKADAEGKETAAAAAKERSERLRKRVHELETAIREVAGTSSAGPDRGPGLEGEVKARADGREERIRELTRQFVIANGRALVAALEADRARAAGKEAEAKEAAERAEWLKKRAHDRDVALREASGESSAGSDRGPGLEGEVKALRAQMNEMRAMLEDLRKRLGDQPK